MFIDCFRRHEHLYEKIVANLIRSDDFVDDIVAVERLLLGSRVILCTLSMLSNHKLSTFTRLVPPQTLIFDEASQIEIGDYFPMLYRFPMIIQKLVFIGDDKQRMFLAFFAPLLAFTFTCHQSHPMAKAMLASFGAYSRCHICESALSSLIHNVSALKKIIT